MLSDTFAGIAPGSVAMLVLMQLIGGVLGYGLDPGALTSP